MKAIAKKIRKRLRFLLHHPLGSKKPVSTLFRYARFHIFHWLFPTPKPYTLLGDVKILATRGWAGVVGNVFVELPEFVEMSFLIHFLRKRDFFLDIGANMGSYTLLAVGILKANVIAIEPLPQIWVLAKIN